MDDPAAQFRANVKQFESYFQEALGLFKGAGYVIRDTSHIKEHYKNPYLTWGKTIEKTWNAPPEINRLVGAFTIMESLGAEPLILSVAFIAEIFQVGSQPRYANRQSFEAGVDQLYSVDLSLWTADQIMALESLLPSAEGHHSA